MSIKRLVALAIALMLCLLSVSSVLAETGVGSTSSFTVDATVINFNNGNNGLIISDMSYMLSDIDGNNVINALDKWYIASYLSRGEGAAGFNERAADVNCDGMVSLVDANLITKMFVGIPPSRQTVLPCVSSVVYKGGASAVIGAKNGCCSFGIDLTGFDFEERDRNAVAVDIDLPEGAEISACPMYNNREAASINENCTAVSTEYGYAFELPAENGRRLTGIMLEISGCSTSVAISEMYMCKNVESAEWICENRIAPATLDRQSLSVNLEGEKTAIRLVGMTDDDRNNTNGGMYHDFVNTKWPSIAVDENDNVYVVGSGNRMAHIDPFGNTLLTVSRDGGKTWGKPQNISNTVMDDRDAGILYLGNGEMLVSYFTSDATSYLSGGSNYSSLKPYSQGGSAPNWAAEWDSSYNPKGGIIGTYLDIISYINRTDSSYDMSAASYIIKSTDYGATWNTEYYDFLGVGYTANAAAMLDNYLITRPGTEVPVTSAHGPMLRSDGRIIFAGKVMNAVDRPMDSMAVYISDDGLEWSYLSEIPTPYGYYYNNFHELSVTENADGALVCAIRAQTCNDKQTAPAATIYTAFSYDGGITWTVPQPTGLDGTPPHVVTLENGDIIMTYSDRTDPRSIRAVVSTDGGRTWSEDAVISDNFFSGDDMGYPASAVLSDGTVVSVWYGTYKPGTANEQYSSILSKRWTYELD